MRLVRVAALLSLLALPASAQIATGPISAPGIDGMGPTSGGGGGIPVVEQGCILVSGTTTNCLLASGTTTNAILVK